jgi:hypothetical protein
MRPAVKHAGLRGGGLALRNQQRLFCARQNGDCFAGHIAHCAGHLRAALSLAGDCGNAKQFALWLRQQVGQTDSIVNVGANISVQQELDGHLRFSRLKSIKIEDWARRICQRAQ